MSVKLAAGADFGGTVVDEKGVCVYEGEGGGSLRGRATD